MSGCVHSRLTSGADNLLSQRAVLLPFGGPAAAGDANALGRAPACGAMSLPLVLDPATWPRLQQQRGKYKFYCYNSV